MNLRPNASSHTLLSCCSVNSVSVALSTGITKYSIPSKPCKKKNQYRLTVNRSFKTFKPLISEKKNNVFSFLFKFKYFAFITRMKNGISIFYIQFVFNTINMKKSWKCYIWMVPNDEILSWIHQLSIHYYATLVVYRRYSDWKTPVKALIISFLHLVFLINIHYKYEQDKFLLFFYS